MSTLSIDDLSIIQDALIDTEMILKRAMNLWEGRGREKYYRNEMIRVQEVSEKIREMIEETPR